MDKKLPVTFLLIISSFLLIGQWDNTMNFEIGTGLSISNGVLGAGVSLEPHYALSNKSSLGIEFSHKDFKWLGDTGIRHKLTSYLLSLQLRSSSKKVTPYFSGRLGYFNLSGIEGYTEQSYGTFGYGFNSGVYIFMVTIGMELNFYTKNHPIEGAGGVFVKVRF